MAERLSVVRCKPTVVIDWWSHAGASRDLLGAAYPQARVLRVEPATAIARPVLPWWRAVLRRRALSIEAAALQPAAAQLVWANMMLHSVDDPGALLGQ